MQSKLVDTSTSIFTIMSQYALQYNAINLGQGFPDFTMSDELIALLNDAMKKGYNQYPHTNGLPLLRERIAEKVEKLYQNAINPETQITITPGGTYAIYTALTTILQQGDEVIVMEPAYDSYIPNIIINGAVPILVQLEFPNYSIPWKEIRNKISSKTKAIILNSPQNPTGAVFSDDDISALRSIINENKQIYLISDEVYEHLIFDGLSHLSILRYPEILERSFVCFSFGKTYHCTGWKIGYCISTPDLMREFRKIHQFNCFTVFTPAQYALAEYLKNEHAYLSLRAFIQQRRDYFQELMVHTSFTPLPSHGSYFQCYDYKSISNENDFDFAVRLTKDFGVATVPLSSFYKSAKDDKVLRFCFAKKEETLERAAERLIKIRS